MAGQGSDSEKPPIDISTVSLWLALVVGAFAAVGVADSLLVRAVRNRPTLVTLVLSIAVGAGALGLLLSPYLPRMPDPVGGNSPVQVVGGSEIQATVDWSILRGLLRGALIVVMAACATGALWIGAQSLRQREQPAVSLKMDRSENGWTLTATGQGSSLPSTEKMLIRTLSLPSTVANTALEDLCRQAALTSVQGEVLSWTETGPNREGDAEAEVSIVVPPTDGFFCAYVALVDDTPATTSDDRTAWAFIRARR